MLYRIGDGDAVIEVESTTLPTEALYEDKIETWVAARPELLGEPLLIIGRQVELDGGKDRIDLLALDQDGALVVIELKRDLIGGSADLQALRYAALVSGWSEPDIRKQAEGYWESTQQDRDFVTEIQEHCGEDAELNQSQRVILAGRDIKPRLGSMALWLIAQGIDVRVVAVGLLKDEQRLYLQPQVVIPPPTDQSLQTKVGIGSSKKPWLVDGKDWHLNNRSGPQGRVILESVIELIGESAPDAEGPHWNQKLYISWKFGSKIWAVAKPGGKQIVLEIVKSAVTAEQAADRLGFEVFDDSAGLADKLALGSSASIVNGDSLRLIIKSPKDVSGECAPKLSQLIADTWASFTGQVGATATNGATPSAGVDAPAVEIAPLVG